MTEITKSKQNKDIKATQKKPEHIGIIIPCKIEEFGDFVTGLIGKPQSLQGEIEGVFEIGNKEISNIYHLVEQRVKEQNEGTLAHFEIKVVYNNGTSISHKSVDDFESYYPTIPGRPEEIIVSFNYLIKFQSRDVPEKQELEIIFSTAPNKSDKRSKWYIGSLIEWRIKHTERTWASDMNGLLKNHANSCIESSSGIWKWLRKNYDEAIYYFGLVVISSVVVSWLFSTYSFLDTAPSQIQIAKYFTVSVTVLMMLYLLIGSLVRMITVHLIIKRESYIHLIDKDKEYIDKQKKKSVRRLAWYLASYLLTLATGVIANIISNLDWARGL